MNFEFSTDIDFENFGDFVSDEIETRYIKPKKYRYKSEHLLKFSNAGKLAKEINLTGNDNIFAILSGSFVFGDFIEALFYEKNIYTEKLQISTLSLSYANIVSLRNLIKGGYIGALDLIVSDYFYAHERNNLIKEIYQELDIDSKFQLAAAASHTKIVSFKTELGKKYTICGSANLRSSNSIEQIHILDNDEMYNFITEINNKIIKSYYTINKPLTNKTAWQAVTEEKGKGKAAEGQSEQH